MLLKADLVIMPCHYKEVDKDERWRLIIYDLPSSKAMLVDSEEESTR